MPLSEHTRYLNPYTDFGFKRLFGTEVNKDVLIDFLNELLNLKSPIKDITYKNTEQLGDTIDDRKAVFDVYCQSENGEYFIVEMQKAIQLYFVERSLFYSTFPIREQAERGRDWNFNLSAVYTVGILDFIYDHDDESYYHHEVRLLDVNTHKHLTDKLNFVYLEMPKFNKTIDECKTILDKIMFVLKNLTTLLDRPAQLQERIFRRIFEVAEISRFSREERFAYEESLKTYRDYTNTIDTAEVLGEKRGFERGKAEGIREGRAEGRAEALKTAAKNLKSIGLPASQIAQATGLSEEEILKL